MNGINGRSSGYRKTWHRHTYSWIILFKEIDCVNKLYQTDVYPVTQSHLGRFGCVGAAVLGVDISGCVEAFARGDDPALTHL